MFDRPAPVIGSALAGLLELALGIYLLVAIGPQSIALFLCVAGACTLTIASLIGRLLRPGPDGPRGGRNGGGDEPPSDEPDWWPAFEVAFREHAQRQASPLR